MFICAYCKSRVFPTDRKCPACGGTVFVTVEEPRHSREEKERDPQALQREMPEPQVVYQTIHKTIYVRERSPKSRWLALLLCLLGGAAGLHRFYTGKIASGVFYLLTGGVFFIGATVDFFSILFGYFRDRDGLLLS